MIVVLFFCRLSAPAQITWQLDRLNALTLCLGYVLPSFCQPMSAFYQVRSVTLMHRSQRSVFADSQTGAAGLLDPVLLGLVQ